MPFSDSYLGSLRSKVGSRLLLVVGGRAIVEDGEGKVLLHLRSDLNHWALPGGSADVGESIEDCVVREVYEETGLSIRNFQAIGFASNPKLCTRTYPNGDQIQAFCIVLYATEWLGQPTVDNDETLDLQFFDLHSLPAGLCDSDKLAIEKCLEFKRTGQFQLF